MCYRVPIVNSMPLSQEGKGIYQYCLPLEFFAPHHKLKSRSGPPVQQYVLLQFAQLLALTVSSILSPTRFPLFVRSHPPRRLSSPLPHLVQINRILAPARDPTMRAPCATSSSSHIKPSSPDWLLRSQLSVDFKQTNLPRQATNSFTNSMNFCNCMRE